MDSKKLDFINDVIRVVRDLCEVVFNIKSSSQLESVFGITCEQMDIVINRIIDALPNHFFDHLYPQILEEIKCICAREFIFFQVQEKWSDPRYQEDLANFIHIFSRDIQQKVDQYKNYKSIMREEDQS